MRQTQGLEARPFGSVAMIGLTGEFSEVWQGKELGDGKVERLTVESRKEEKELGHRPGGQRGIAVVASDYQRTC